MITGLLGTPVGYGPPARSPGWSLKAAARPFAGVEITMPVLNRPGYRAAVELVAEFETLTGIHVRWRELDYVQLRDDQIEDLREKTSTFDLLLFDCVWIGQFVSEGWLTPLGEFYTEPELADPELELHGFFQVLLGVLGTWRRVIYGMPFDSYAGLLYYNKTLLRTAGLTGPPTHWSELLKLAPRLTGGGRHAFALPSLAGETQTADSFLRMLRQAGGELIDPGTFEPRLHTPAAGEGLEFRQRLREYMPPEVTGWDHQDALRALEHDRVAMVTDWNPGFEALPSHIGVTVEPIGLDGDRHPPLGGFSFGVSSQVAPERQRAAWLLIQWLTSARVAARHINAGGSPARRGAYSGQGSGQRDPRLNPLLRTWSNYVDPAYRPRFAEYPGVSELISTEGLRLMHGQRDIPDAVRVIEGGLRELLDDYLTGLKPKVL